MLRRPYDELIDMYRRRGSVVKTRMGPIRFTYLLGPEANQFVFANSHLFRWREAMEFLVPITGETALLVSDGDTHKRRRRLVAPAFHHRQIAGYVDAFRRNADRVIDEWQPGTVVDAYAEFRRAIRRSTIELLFGDRLAADEQQLGDQLQLVLDLLDLLPVERLLQERLGLPTWKRAQVAKAEVDVRIYEEIAYRRANPDDSATDVLSALVEAVDEDGSQLSDEEIRDQVISLIAAGYETTSAAMGWLVHELVNAPEHWEPAPYDAPEIANLVSEVLRLHPPAVFSGRYVTTEFEFAGEQIPAGTQLVISPFITHRLEEIWPEPKRFDPERWNPDRPGYHKPTPAEFLPFAAGPHRCIGATFATVELQVIVSRMLERVTLSPVPQRIQPIGYGAMRPRYGVQVRVDDVR
ncbi:cytochrome P450 [Kribbella antibiotica]|uniref:Cytochrome P450 n=1 Tax=Kribbella antibiotica TaxID=190195 RepID=A0A4R4ZFX2_9ACTN|nr:cytochrome P450 [Kribbella antibiotica]